MRRVNYQIEKETIDSQVKAGRFNPALELTFRDKTGTHTHTIGAGHSDTLDVYRDGKETFVLVRNFGMGYVGLEGFKGDEKIGNVFLQSDYEVKEIVGNIDLMPYTLIRRMAQYIY
jgi:hypothetical protein